MIKNLLEILKSFASYSLGGDLPSERAEVIIPELKIWETKPGSLPFGVGDNKDFLVLPTEEEVKNLLIIATPGQGKSLYLNCVVSKTVCLNHLTGRSRSVVFDVKGDQEVLFKAHGITPKVFNPLKETFTAFSLASFVRNELDAERLTLALLNTTKELVSQGDDKYWKETCKTLLQSVITTFVLKVHRKKIDEFTFRDIFNAIALVTFNERGAIELDELMQFLSILTPDDAQKVYAFLSDPRHGATHYSSLTTVVNQWKLIAARDSHATERVGINDWDCPWLLGFDAEADNLLVPLNRFILESLTNHCTMLGNTPEERDFDTTYFIIDEGLMVLPVPGLSKLMDVGRAKGVCVFLTLLNLSKAKDILGENELSSTLSYFKSLAVLGVSIEDANFLCQRKIGEHTVTYTEPIVEYCYTYEVTLTDEDGNISYSTIISNQTIARTDHRLINKERKIIGTSKEEKRELLVQPEDLGRIPPPSKKGATMFFYREDQLAQKALVTLKMLQKGCPDSSKSRLTPIPTIDKTNPEYFEIEPWTESERNKFCS